MNEFWKSQEALHMLERASSTHKPDWIVSGGYISSIAPLPELTREDIMGPHED